MSLDRLPAEILQKIFDYLPRTEQLEKTSISRRWNQLALRETYLILAYGEQLISERILRRTTRGYCCFSIEFSEAFEGVQSRLALCAGKFRLRKLILDGIQTYALVSFIGEHREWLRSAVNFSVTVSNQVDSGETDVQLDLPRLRTLSWTYNSDGGSRVLPMFRLNTPLVEYAYIESSETDRAPLILECTEKLKSLELFLPKLIVDLFPSGLDLLDCLRIYNSDSPFEWNHEQLKLPRLTKLELCGCTLNNQSQALLRIFSNLETLIIQGEYTNLIDLRVIARSLPRLRQLRLFDVKWTYGPDFIAFPSLQILDIDDTRMVEEIHEDLHHYGLVIEAPRLMTIKGTYLNLHSFKLRNYSTVKCMITYGPYLNFMHPRLFASIMILYMDVPCHDTELLLTESLHQFPALTRLTIVLHEKRFPVHLSGYQLTLSFVHLNYLHLRNFDLDYSFLQGIFKSNSLGILILQDGTLKVKPDDNSINTDQLFHFFVQNVKLPKGITKFPVSYPATDMDLSLEDGNLFSTRSWNENIIKSREDYVTFLLI